MRRGDQAQHVDFAGGQPRLVHARAGHHPPIVLINRVEIVAWRSTCHSSSPSIPISSDHGLSHATSMAHCTAALGVTELKYLAQLCWPGVVE
jgi:hypothetical protein